MKKTCLFLTVLAIVLNMPNNALGVGYVCTYDQFDSEGQCSSSCGTVNMVYDCGTSGVYCDCASCSGLLQTLEETTVTVSSSETITYNKCVASGGISVDCSTCVSTDWAAYSTGYESKVSATCNTRTGACKRTTSYRCAAGYYGSSTNGTSGCSKCPSPGTTAAGATSITECCIPSGTTGSDTTGTYTYTSQCCYSN